MLARSALAAFLAVVLFGTVASARPRQRTPAPPKSVTTFVISGHGWGHGVGLAQYGALGYAQHGWTYDKILAHYYPGTALGAAPVSKVRVLVAEQRAKASVSSAAPFRARDGTGVRRSYNAGPVQVSATGVNLVLPVTFLPGAAPLELDGKAYRGTLEFSLAGKRLNGVNAVGIDQYLYGVVASEMESDWPLEALKAQAVAARSYALYNRRSGGSFDLYADTRSQAYGGVAGEAASARAAVDATARRVLLYNGKVADTFFYASSGGRTADATEVWSEKPIPYLVSVNDPYDTLSPYHDWGPVVLTAEQVARTLGIVGLRELVPNTGASGRARTITAAGVLGDVEVDGSAFRRALELRSTWLTIGELSVDRPLSVLVYGARSKLTGRVRSLKKTVLEQRVPASVWRTLPAFASASDGSFAAVIAPKQTIEVRLRYGTIAGQTVKLVVVPSVAATASADGTGISGRIRPLVSGVEIEGQQLSGKTWTTLDSVAPDSAGRFALQLNPGEYRIRYAPGAGLGAGYSGVITVG